MKTKNKILAVFLVLYAVSIISNAALIATTVPVSNTWMQGLIPQNYVLDTTSVTKVSAVSQQYIPVATVTVWDSNMNPIKSMIVFHAEACVVSITSRCKPYSHTNIHGQVIFVEVL
jgi:hypothetical protein